MKPIGDTPPAWRARSHQVLLPARAVQKPSDTSCLHQDSEDRAQAAPSPSAAARIPATPRNGTARAVPFGNGLAPARLVSTFVAQLLGQMLPDPERPAMADYGRALRTPPRFDTCV